MTQITTPTAGPWETRRAGAGRGYFFDGAGRPTMLWIGLIVRRYA